jgi:asparagine synthase (glutamine-hydrolysing)
MCGIVGAISAKPIDPGTIAEMRDSMAHRGPDHAGLWSAKDSCVCLGHRRLAIVDLNAEANQPFISHDDRFIITFNGEIYNYRSLAHQLRQHGVVFRTQSDTEVLVEAFRHWGQQCLERLSGMFAFAIWDTRERKLFCARDRAGEKPFYYATVNGAFLFASELKAIVAWPEFRKQLHFPALVDFLTFGFVPDPKCVWEGCQKLSPGHFMFVETDSQGAPAIGKPSAYWDMEFAPDDSVSDWGPKILETLQNAAKEMSLADVPVGAFLSGGVDSSSVTAALSRSGCAVNTFTVGFQDKDYDERRWAQTVSQLYATKHTEKLVVPRDVSSVFDKLLWHYDEPFNDYSYLPTFYVCREARKIITVALSGDGGDEMFAGYKKYQRLSVRQIFQPFLRRPVRGLLARAESVFPRDGRQRQALASYGMDAPTMLLDMLTTCFPLRALRTAARGPLAETLKNYSPTDVVAPLLAKAPPKDVGLVNAMRYLDLKLTLAGDMLVKVDRASMAVSLEVRPVYLHRDVVSLAAKIPPRLLVDRKHAKKALKRALRPWLPNDILYRDKMGFGVPLKKWLNGDLSHLFSVSTEQGPLAELLDRGLMARLTHQHLSGSADLSSAIHSIALLNSWLGKWTGAKGQQAESNPIEARSVSTLF